MKPKHSALKFLSKDVYKKLPKKDLTEKTIKYLARNYPKELGAIIYSDILSAQELLIILDVLSYIKNDYFELILIDLTKEAIPAVREAACFALSRYGTNKAASRLLDCLITETNISIREITGSYFVERN